MRFILLGGWTAFFLGFSSGLVGAEEQQANLTQVEARARAKRVSDVRYDLSLQLSEKESYSGQQKINFRLSGAKENLRLDFYRGDVHALVINERRVESIARTSTHLTLPQAFLREGENEVWVTFATQTENDGTGLHRFQDPEDDSVFLYTQFETFYAHKVMPCFDQPDLKARWRLTVDAPKNWTVVSTTQEKFVGGKGAKKVWAFAETPPLATYLFSLHAGPFRIWKDSFAGIPLRLMARPSMAQYVQPDFWFRTTKQGLGFYNRYFAYPYPFKKYDQLIVPEFNAGAMENVGAVTFSERYLRRGKITREEELGNASVILHEMAHMWFGNLVTMRWWDDLWLNESFATYMASLALHQATPYKESWLDFFDSKTWAYYQDQLSTTHPIAGEIADTNAADSSFDGITYEKGAAALKQLSRWVSPEVFRRGMRHYMRAHAYKNTALPDFIQALQKFSLKNLESWSKAWLEQAGLEVVRVGVECRGNSFHRLTLRANSSVPAARLRPQSLELGFYEKNGEKLRLVESRTVDFSGNQQTYSFTGLKCPVFVYPNQNDHGYLGVVLEESAIAALTKGLGTIADPLTRMQLWSNLWRMVWDQELPLASYAQIIRAQLGSEKDLRVLSFLLDSIAGDSSDGFAGNLNVVGFWSAGGRKENFIRDVKKIYASRLAKAAPGSDEQMLWWDSLVAITGFLTGEQGAELRVGLGVGKLPRGLNLDQDRRWNLVNRLCRMGQPDCLALVATEQARDSSDRGEKGALASRASYREGDKKELLKEALSSEGLSLQGREAIAHHLFPYEQRSRMREFWPEIFRHLEMNMHAADLESLTSLASGLSILHCEEAAAQRLRRFLQEHSDLPSSLRREFQEQLDEDAICQGVRTKSARAN